MNFKTLLQILQNTVDTEDVAQLSACERALMNHILGQKDDDVASTASEKGAADRLSDYEDENNDK